MRDTQLYQQVLGLTAPWSVDRVELNIDDGRVDIWVEHEPAHRWACPACEQLLNCRDHAEERVWRHLDTCQLKTYLHARVPRVACPEHGVRQVAVPWAEPHSRFTMLMERLIIDVATQCATVTGVSRLLRTGWDQTWAVMERAVARGRRRKAAEPMAHLGVDEKAFRKGHSYVTVVCDLKRATVEHVADDRKSESLAGYFRSLSPRQLQGIEAVAMDMWEPYVKATLECVPLAADKIVFDRFHAMKHVNDAVDKVRRQEHRALTAEGDDRLKGTKYFWLYGMNTLPDRHLPDFESLCTAQLKTSRAWAIKETLRQLWDYRSAGWARRFFRRWSAWASRSRLEPIRRAAKTLRDHLDQILTYCKHRITNAVAEGLNSKIMGIKRKAAGYANPEHFKTVIYFYCGGLDLYPR